jgi:hypothetical protein
MTNPRQWISAETERKERHFRGIVRMHANICKGIARRHGIASPYLYADLYAGPGSLRWKNREFDGSPLIARDELTRTGLPYQAVHFEEDAAVAAQLGEALWTPASLLDAPDPDNSPVFAERCQDAYPRWLASGEGRRDRHGLVYSDPIGDPIPVDLLNATAEKFPRVDLLAYVAANSQYKRKGGSERTRFLADDIAAVNKDIVLIRRPFTAFQWTFVLWTNWAQLPEWQKEGFYRLDSETGRQILDQLNLTAREHREKANTPLFGRHYQRPEPGETYSSYAEYLKHPRFLAVRAQVFERAAGKCERCGERPPTDPHHLRYPPWGAFDAPENLIAICHACHCEIHEKAA